MGYRMEEIISRKEAERHHQEALEGIGKKEQITRLTPSNEGKLKIVKGYANCKHLKDKDLMEIEGEKFQFRVANYNGETDEWEVILWD